MSPDMIQQILLEWNVREYILLPNDSLYGSPERSLKRFLIKDKKGVLYILDQIDKMLLPRKKTIAENLERLHKNQTLPIHPYLTNQHNEYISEQNQTYWMLSTFISHIPLNRLHYFEEEWRGKAIAEFIISLKNSVQQLPDKGKVVWELPLDQYIAGLMKTIEQYHPDSISRIEPVLSYLQDFFSHYHELETTFSHGDLHPTNILWGDHQILSVIDWEFSGMKPKLYDTANILGCLGMEKPVAFTSGMAIQLVRTLKMAFLFTEGEWKRIIELIIALRFGWLSEWFRKKDHEMVDLELTYMNFLITNKKELLSYWNSL